MAIELQRDLFEEEMDEWELGTPLAAHLRKQLNPVQWRYTGKNFRLDWMIHVRRDNSSRPMTLWPGRKLVASCLDRRESLAKETRKKLNERLRRLAGRDQYDFWLRIEAPKGKPNDVHIHGFLEMYDASWWSQPKYRQLRREIKEAVGTDCKAESNKQLYFRHMVFDTNWLKYAAKQRKRHPLIQKRAPYLAEEFIEPWEAQTRRLKTRAIERYGEVRNVIQSVLRT